MLLVLAGIGCINAQSDDDSYENEEIPSDYGRPDFSKYFSVENHPQLTTKDYASPTQFSTFFAAPSRANFKPVKDAPKISEYNLADFGEQDFFEKGGQKKQESRVEPQRKLVEDVDDYGGFRPSQEVVEEESPATITYAKTDQKFDYRPTNFSGENQPSESTPQPTIRGQKCTKSVKVSSNKPMACLVCTDPKTGAKNERCSYNNEPQPKSYYHSTSYGTPQNAYRSKREETGTYSDPYEEIQYHSYNRKPGRSKPHTSESAKIAQNLKKNCRNRIKDGLTCTTCKDPKTGGSYEQCSYESQPAEKKYAYAKEKNYDSIEEAQEEEPTSNEDYHSKIEEDSQDQRGDVERIFQEFSKRDRSKCKQSLKKGMTCYLCVDENGMKNEECMYVSESRPVGTRMAYHKLQLEEDERGDGEIV